LYESWASRLFGDMMTLTRDRHLAEDSLHNLFVKLATSGVDVRNPAVYLFRAARNEALSISRRGHLRLLPAIDIIAPDEKADFDISPSELISALDRLPNEQAETVILHVLEGLTFKDIGEITDCSLDTVASRYRYALDKLQNLLRP